MSWDLLCYLIRLYCFEYYNNSSTESDSYWKYIDVHWFVAVPNPTGRRTRFLSILHHMSTPWRNGSASDSRSEGCVFKSRRGQKFFCSFYCYRNKTFLISLFGRTFNFLDSMSLLSCCNSNMILIKTEKFKCRQNIFL